MILNYIYLIKNLENLKIIKLLLLKILKFMQIICLNIKVRALSINFHCCDLFPFIITKKSF